MDLLRSLPLGLYLEKPVTWMHHLDPRVKLAWLGTFLTAPLLASPHWRIGIVALLIGLTLTASIPLRVWRQQMGLLLFLCVMVLVITTLAPDGLAINYQPRLPASDLDLPQPTDYQYIVVQFRWITITRRSLDVGIRVSSLLFTLVYSCNLYLLTTAPEEITTALEQLLSPLRRFHVPVTEIILSLTLALRFIPLVLEEIQNLVRSVSTRAINWQKLGLKNGFQLWLMIAEKLLENLLTRAQQIAIAMQVRGFTSPDQHLVQWYKLKITWQDWIVLGLLGPFWLARWCFG